MPCFYQASSAPPAHILNHKVLLLPLAPITLCTPAPLLNRVLVIFHTLFLEPTHPLPPSSQGVAVA